MSTAQELRDLGGPEDADSCHLLPGICFHRLAYQDWRRLRLGQRQEQGQRRDGSKNGI